MSFLENPVSPNLPLAPKEYDSRYQEQFNNILRLYFNRLGGNLSSLLGRSGGQYLQLPYGSFYDTTDQTAASTTVAYPITLNSTSLSNGVAVKSDSKITVGQNGVYSVQFRVQLANDDSAPQDVDVWFRINDTDVANSNTRFGLAARKGPSDPFHTVGTVNLLLDLVANDYVQLVWRTTDLDARIEAYAAGTSPTRPEIPSVIAVVTFVSGVA